MTDHPTLADLDGAVPFSYRHIGPSRAEQSQMLGTLGFGSIIYTVTTYWVDLTRGPMGISNIPYFSFGFGSPVFESARANYYLALGFVLVAGYACHALVSSRTGRAFIALRENAPLAVWGTKMGILQGLGVSIPQAEEIAAGYLEVNEQTEDFLEGPRSFVEKSKPVWKGR